jgi:hypothetical protein
MSGIAPYGNAAADFMYNLLFCDDPALFARAKDGPQTPISAVLADNPDAARIADIAGDTAQESRVRVLAFNWLRRQGRAVPKRLLLGTIVEVPLEGGLDTLAAFVDGSVRYINQTGKVSVFEGAVPAIQPAVRALLAAAQGVVDKIGPWDKPRLPAPKAGNVRLTFLVSDGLYFGEGKFEDLSRDGLGGPVINAAGQLLTQVVDLATRTP